MRSGGEEVTVDSLLWRSPAHRLRAEDGAGQRGAGLQVSLKIYIQKEVGRKRDVGVGDPFPYGTIKKKGGDVSHEFYHQNLLIIYLNFQQNC
jgi:hypothetical protein